MINLWLAQKFQSLADKYRKKANGKFRLDIGDKEADVSVVSQDEDPTENGRYIQEGYYRNIELYIKGYASEIGIDRQRVIEEGSEDEDLPDTIESPEDYAGRDMDTDAIISRPYFEEWICLEALDQAFDSGENEELRKLLMMGFGAIGVLIIMVTMV